MAPGNQHGPRWLAIPQASTELLVATEAMNTTADSRLHGAMNLDMALGSSLCLEVSMAPGGSTGHPDQHDSGHGIVLGHVTDCGPDSRHPFC